MKTRLDGHPEESSKSAPAEGWTVADHRDQGGIANGLVDRRARRVWFGWRPLLRRVTGGALVFLLATAHSGLLRAGTHTWTGLGRNGLWSNADNWSTTPPAVRESDVRLVFPAQLRTVQQPINDLRGLVVTSIAFSGAHYRVDALSTAEGLTLAAGATVTVNASSNILGASLRLTLGSGDVSVFVADNVQFRVQSAVIGAGTMAKTGTGEIWLEGDAPNSMARLRVSGGMAVLNKAPGIAAVGGDLEIQSFGRVRLDADEQLPDTSVVTLSTAASLPVFDLNRQTETIAGLTGGGMIDLGDAPLYPFVPQRGVLQLDVVSGSSYSFQGPIFGLNGSIRKRGEGTMTFNYSDALLLKEPSSYSGSTIVEGGALYLNALSPSSTVQVLGNATLGGTEPPGILLPPLAWIGRVRMVDGIFAPGSRENGIVSPLQTQSLTMEAGSQFQVHLVSAAVYNRVQVSGSVQLNQPTLNLTANYQPTAGSVFTVIANDSTDPVIGYFAGQPEGSAVEVGGLKYRVSYVGGDGNDVTLTRLGVIVPGTRPVLSAHVQPLLSGGSNVLSLFASARAAERFKVEASESLQDSNGWRLIGEAVADEFGVVHFDDREFGRNRQRFYRFAPSPLSPVLEPLAASRFGSKSNLSTELLAAVDEHLRHFDPARVPGSAWANVEIAPTVTWIHDPTSTDPEQPAYAELRVVAAGQPNGPSKGYLLVSLTAADKPIVEFATSGAPKTERLLRQASSGTPDKIMRFSSVYWTVENAAGQRLGEWGTPPALPDGSTAGLRTAGRMALNSANGLRELSTVINPPTLPAYDYRALKTAFRSSPMIANFRQSRQQLAATTWNRLRGVRLPRLTVAVHQTASLLAGTSLLRAQLDTDADQAPIATIRLAPEGNGIIATGLAAGSAPLRVIAADGRPLTYILVVTAATGGGVAGGEPQFAPAGGCLSAKLEIWWAGSSVWGEGGDQRYYNQLKDDERWCPAVGCGPTALAMLFGWWDAHGVPSAFYILDSGRGNKDHFRLNESSVKRKDAPQWSGNDEARMRAIYQDLHELCNTFCSLGKGATFPDQLASAFLEYTLRVASAHGSPQNEFGDYLVGAEATASWNDFFALGGTDWEGGGKAVANGIKENRPGIVGIWNGIVLHYALAFGYQRIEHFDNCESDGVDRWFYCNMGWGENHPPEWHDAEAVWFGLTANLWQQKTWPPTLTNRLPEIAVFNADLDPGRCAAVMDDSGNRIDLFSLFDRKAPGSFEHVHSSDAGSAWYRGLDPTLASGVFRSSPAATVSTAGSTIDLFGRGMDNKYWRARSLNGGTNFGSWAPLGPPASVYEFASAPAVAGSANAQLLHLFGRIGNGQYLHSRLLPGFGTWTSWLAVGAGLFTSAPAAACSGDGQKVFLFGRGQDDAIWWNRSVNGGTNWTGWAPIGNGQVFKSAPAAAASADGNALHLVALGYDNRYWRTVALGNGVTWAWSNWVPIGDGVFSSGPAVVCSSDGAKVHVFGRGTPPPPPPPGVLPAPDLPRLWRAYSANSAASWQIAWDDIQPELE